MVHLISKYLEAYLPDSFRPFLLRSWKERIESDIIRDYLFSLSKKYKEGEQLENYTKYKLKSNDELASVLEGKDNLFVIACNKC